MCVSSMLTNTNLQRQSIGQMAVTYSLNNEER